MVFFLTINLIKYNSEFNSILWFTRPYVEPLNWVMVFRLQSSDYRQSEARPGVMKFTCNLMHIDLTFYTIFVPRIWFQVSGFGCQQTGDGEQKTEDSRVLHPPVFTIWRLASVLWNPKTETRTLVSDSTTLESVFWSNWPLFRPEAALNSETRHPKRGIKIG